MIASPSDVAQVRSVVREVIHTWNAVFSEKEASVLMPIGWESHAFPALGARPQAIINRQVLEDADLLVALFWTRLGSPTDQAPSGTVEEIETHLKAGKPAMIYFSSQPAVPESIDPKQYEALLKFKEDLRLRGLFETFASPAEFREKFTRQLAQTIVRHFPPREEPPCPSGTIDRPPGFDTVISSCRRQTTTRRHPREGWQHPSAAYRWRTQCAVQRERLRANDRRTRGERRLPVAGRR